MKLSSQLLKSLVAGSFVGLAVGSSSAVYAATQTFTTIPDPSGVSASATFITSTNQISLTLTNTTANIQSLAQTLSDISFSVTGGTTVLTSDVSALNANFITLTDGAATQTSGPGTSNPWSLSGGSGSYLFTGLNGGDQTRTLILSPVPSDFCQPSKCPDGLGNANFNPFIDHTATFILGITGVTSGSTISDVVFSFGTGPETLVGVPIPAAAWLFASGLLGLIGIARRKQSAAVTPA